VAREKNQDLGALPLAKEPRKGTRPLDPVLIFCLFNYFIGDRDVSKNDLLIS
jgi:hypothetical protein